MTTIAAFLDHKGNVAIASDGSVTTAFIVDMGSKLYRVRDGDSPLVVGCAGALPSVQLLVPYRAEEEIDVAAAASACALAWRQQLKDIGAGKVDDAGTWTTSAMGIMVGKGQKPWRLWGDGSAHECLDGFVASGSGEEVAMGVLYLARVCQIDAEDAVRQAVEAANALTPHSRFGPYVEVITAESDR